MNSSRWVLPTRVKKYGPHYTKMGIRPLKPAENLEKRDYLEKSRMLQNFFFTSLKSNTFHTFQVTFIEIE